MSQLVISILLFIVDFTNIQLCANFSTLDLQTKESTRERGNPQAYTLTKDPNTNRVKHLFLCILDYQLQMFRCILFNRNVLHLILNQRGGGGDPRLTRSPNTPILTGLNIFSSAYFTVSFKCFNAFYSIETFRT